MSSLKIPVCAFLGMTGAAIASLFGGWTEDMVTLIIVMSIDFLLGLIIAFVFGKSPKSENGAASSKSCFKGLAKKCAVLLFVLIAHRLDISLNTDYIKTATVIAFIANELISIVENAGIIGLPLPKKLLAAIDLFKEDGDA